MKEFIRRARQVLAPISYAIVCIIGGLVAGDIFSMTGSFASIGIITAMSLMGATMLYTVVMGEEV